MTMYHRETDSIKVANNASEIASFDPLVDELEKQIQQARNPEWISVTVSRVD